jgi:outer membrane protein assembly factor BamB
VDLSTSKVAWRCSIQSPLLAPPVILDGVCYVGTLSGKVLAYEVPE